MIRLLMNQPKIIYTAFNCFAPKTYGLNICNDFSKYFCFKSNDHHVLGLINTFNNEDRNDSDCSGIFNHICSILPQELLERIDSMCYQNDNDDKDDDSQAYVAIEKTVLEMSLNGKCQNDYPKLNERLKQLKKKLSMGFCCIIAVINTRRIYVANIGDNRAIICKDDNNLSIELSIRHDFKNQDEIERLKNLSIDIEPC
ncbi:TGF-beta-activated kinase 1 and MAP3K7-binding protein 1 [Sarcoptes scabiei]|uniref:TGF-beta-activated kinase 1 and MAP3K7-binding protein 1 n=1 Tax=Sarcoptes scabiei TaxID=52283 RepID=A0A834R6B7_SARSC|nr:TGF-beta-activated kinase 1 and MAP3K7-binding protein 1 [Sarcoptes scabiei]